jgi:hypothetical protein
MVEESETDAGFWDMRANMKTARVWSRCCSCVPREILPTGSRWLQSSAQRLVSRNPQRLTLLTFINRHWYGSIVVHLAVSCRLRTLFEPLCAHFEPLCAHFGNDLPLHPREDYIGLPATTTGAHEPRAPIEDRCRVAVLAAISDAMGHDLAGRTIGTM